MNTSTVSVIIPTYNRAHMVGRAIESVLVQTYRDLELIVVDDGSTDNTGGIVGNFSDSRLTYIKLRKNSGASAVPRNAGLKIARGEYVAFLDSDDEWLPEKLEKQINKFQTLPKPNNVGIVYCGFYYISEKSGQIAHVVAPNFRGNVFTNFLEGNIMGSLTTLIKRECFEKIGYFDEALSRSQDYDMWMRLSRYYDFDFVMEMLAKYHIHQDQRSPNLNAQIQTKEQLIEKYRVDLLKHPAILSKRLGHLGKLHFLAGETGRSFECFLSAIRYSPFKRHNYVQLLFALLLPSKYMKIVKKIGLTIDDVTFY